MSSGLRVVEGVNVLPVDGLWDHIAELPAELKLTEALEYAGCDFLDDRRRVVAGHVVSFAGVGGLPIARASESDAEIAKTIDNARQRTREIMGSSAAFSYLNSGEKPITDLYDSVTRLGHFSIAHTVYVNMVVAGISQATELELSLQRDLVHISKVTNARTKVQNTPPLVGGGGLSTKLLEALHDMYSKTAELARGSGDLDRLEFANSLYPTRKATMLMLSGDLSNFRKFSRIEDDEGKEEELREVARSVGDQLGRVWPEIFAKQEGK